MNNNGKSNSHPYYYQAINEAPASVVSRSSSYIGRITNFEFIKNNGIIKAEVQGSKLYQMRITKHDNDFYYECTCPFNQKGSGSICKHLIALTKLMKKKEINFDDASFINVKVVEPEKPKTPVTAILDTSNEFYKNIINSIISTDKNQSSNYSDRLIADQKQSSFSDISFYLGFSICNDDNETNKIWTTPTFKTAKINKKTQNCSIVSFKSVENNYDDLKTYVSKSDFDFLNHLLGEKIYLRQSNYYGYSYGSIEKYNNDLSYKKILELINNVGDLGKLFIEKAKVKAIYTNSLLKLEFEYNEKTKKYYPKLKVINSQGDERIVKTDIVSKDIINKVIFSENKFILATTEQKKASSDIITACSLYLLNNNTIPEFFITFIYNPLLPLDSDELKNLIRNIKTHNVTEDLIIIPNELKPEIKNLSNPTFEIYLSEEEYQLITEFKFKYDEFETAFRLKYNDITLTKLDQNNQTIYYQRDQLKEYEIISEVKETLGELYSAKLNWNTGINHFTGEDIVDFLINSLSNLEENITLKNRVNIHGQSNLKKHRFIKPVFNFEISSGIDWLDIKGDVVIDGQKVDLEHIAKLIRKKQKFIQLGDKTGVLPQEWLDKYSQVFELGEIKDGGVKISKWHLTLLQDFVDTLEQKDLNKEHFHKQVKSIIDIKNIKKLDKPKVKATLRHYQQEGYEWLNFLHTNNLGGILADDMGLGKTLQVISFLNYLYTESKNKKTLAKSLIILPRSLITNWQIEIQKFSPKLSFEILYGTNRDKEIFNTSKTNLILTTYGTAIRDIETLKSYKFECIVLDESQQIKNANSLTFKGIKLLDANFRLSLSGTPVENSLLDLWSQFSFLNPGMLGSQTHFKSSFVTNKNEDAVNQLRTIVNPFILRRLKQDVAKELGDKVENTVYVDMNEKQQKLYDEVKLYYQKKISQEIDSGEKNVKMRVLEGLMKLRQICCHPELLNTDKKYESSKLEAMLEKLETVISEGHKVLVFSQFTSMLAIVREKLDAQQVPYCYLDGKTKDRQAVVDQFQNTPETPAFLISLKAGGVGLNLTAADYVFIFDPWWNPAVENQAIDRSHRIGQDKTVFVYKFVVNKSVEEKILELQVEKNKLVKNVLSNDESLLKKMDKKTILNLFS